MTTRPERWEGMLADHIASAGPFAWGTIDCVLWCADWVRQMTGTDHADGIRGTYADEAGAKVALASLGFASISDLIGHYLPETPAKKARRGDIMLHPMDIAGICDGAHAYFLTENGVTRIPFTACTKAWKVE